MKFINILRQDLNKTVINGGFIAAALITCVLCFTANAYTDMSNEKTYSVFEAIFTLDKTVVNSNYSFASIVIFQKALSGYITMFIPIIVAFPFMVSFCAERNNGLMRFTITRTGKYRYYFSKFFAAFLSGGFAVLIGVILFGVCVVMIFPQLSSYEVSADDLAWLLPSTTAKAIIKMLCAAFLYGAVSTLPAFFLGSFCKNPYIITCLPFMLNYVWNTALSKATLKGFENGDFEIYDKVAAFYPDGIANISHMTEFNKTMQKMVAFNVGYVVILLVGFILVMNSRMDKGS